MRSRAQRGEYEPSAQLWVRLEWKSSEEYECLYCDFCNVLSDIKHEFFSFKYENSCFVIAQNNRQVKLSLV